ncbi:hypothetical protein ABID16_003090 [Rhizobium aquaticum]|uniref:Uncharacterized protein n=1 Tax=Rhizobium aquaticum TaxID=1549636 RepID=A0ABV2J205_9HYPH
MQTLEHLTLLTGHRRNSPRREVHPQIIEYLKPYVLNGTGKIGKTAWTLKMVQGACPGSCGFTLHHAGIWLFSCYMAWKTTADLPMWGVVTELSKTSVTKPKTVPWLAVHIMPQVVDADLNIMKEAGDLERCIAWTVINTMAGNSPLAA